jgi:hypothetical protein
LEKGIDVMDHPWLEQEGMGKDSFPQSGAGKTSERTRESLSGELPNELWRGKWILGSALLLFSFSFLLLF